MDDHIVREGEERYWRISGERFTINRGGAKSLRTLFFPRSGQWCGMDGMTSLSAVRDHEFGFGSMVCKGWISPRMILKIF